MGPIRSAEILVVDGGLTVRHGDFCAWSFTDWHERHEPITEGRNTRADFDAAVRSIVPFAHVDDIRAAVARTRRLQA